ncbi:MAG: hypothetical protein LDLANPLL_02795 [Turneriella sp.]|nr:hypothetical protein [Turneriella sp.]
MVKKKTPKSLFILYVQFIQKVSFGGALVLLSLPLIPLVNSYAYFFLQGIESEVLSKIYQPESIAFRFAIWIALFFFLIFGGAFHRLGIPSILSSIRRLETSVRGFSNDYTVEELRRILLLFSRIPRDFTLLTLGIYTLQLLIVYGYGFYVRGNATDVKLFYIPNVVTYVMLAGLVFSFVEFLCGSLRVRVKRSLLLLGESANDVVPSKKLSSGNLFFIFFVGGISTFSLIAFLRFRHDTVLWPAIGVSIVTFVICGILLTIYLYSWKFSILQIVEATRDVASGGRGMLPIFSNSRELTNLAINFDAATHEIHSIRNYLNELVDEKTRKVTDAYNELKALKSRQDGDYYLTANLIDSLNEVRPDSANVLVETFAKQFKTFEFMEHSHEIGGDMNCAYALNLHGEKYTLVVNADAMGKSLQGASGVLVLGTAFRSLLERTRITEELRNMSPERWLKNAFLEFHRLFSSFNGSMMVSMVCLLVHDKSGFTVMINAEHPPGILLREGRSEYISGHEGLRKLGNTAVKGRLWVDTFVFKPNDIIILGSDGRDDVIIGYDETGQPIINQDEGRILTIVRLAEGDLTRIYQNLKKMGEIVDDVSLVRIKFHKEHDAVDNSAVELIWKKYYTEKSIDAKLECLREILRLDLNNSKAWKTLLLFHLRAENLVDAAQVGETLVRLTPQRDSLLFVTGLLAYRNGDYDKALYYIDRLTLRNWYREDYLILLGKIYESKNDARGMREAGLLLTELEPLHEYGKKLLETSV